MVTKLLPLPLTLSYFPLSSFPDSYCLLLSLFPKLLSFFFLSLSISLPRFLFSLSLFLSLSNPHPLFLFLFPTSSSLFSPSWLNFCSLTHFLLSSSIFLSSFCMFHPQSLFSFLILSLVSPFHSFCLPLVHSKLSLFFLFSPPPTHHTYPLFLPTCLSLSLWLDLPSSFAFSPRLYPVLFLLVPSSDFLSRSSLFSLHFRPSSSPLGLSRVYLHTHTSRRDLYLLSSFRRESHKEAVT